MLERGQDTVREEREPCAAGVHVDLSIDDELAIAVAQARHTPVETDARTASPLLQNRSGLVAHVLANDPHNIDRKAVGKKMGLVMPNCAQRTRDAHS